MILNKSKSFFLVSLICLGLFPLIFNSVNGFNARESNSIETQEKNKLKTSATSTYVIVTTEAIQSGSTNLTKFIQYKESIGFNVEVINETEYGLPAGETRVLNIRNWLKDNYTKMNIEYVLLIGNPDPGDTSAQSVPMLMCWPRLGIGDGHDEMSPTDYIYADLTGDWDSGPGVGDGIYGEYSVDNGVDFNAEVFVGRIPVYGSGPTYDDLDNILWRISIHHNNSGAEKKKILLPMAISNYENEDMDGNGVADNVRRTDGLDCPYYIWNNIAKERGMSDTVMYETMGRDPVSGGYHHDKDLTKTNFIDELNTNYGAVFWWAHGDATGASRKYWTSDDGDNIPEPIEMTWTSFIDSTDTINNDKPAFIFQSSCTNGAPEISNNLGYKLLKDGVAISTVSALRESWYKTNVWYPTTTYADNTNIGYYYMYNLIRNDMSSGRALYSAKSAFTNYWGDESWQNLMDFNLYGDPSLCYWEESPTSSTSAAPIEDDDDDGDDSSSSSNVYLDFFNENSTVIIAGLIGAGALTTAIVVVISKKKGKQPSRDMAPSSQYYSPPPPPAYTSSSQAFQPAVPLITPSSYCSKCGAVLRQGSSFCVMCGGKKTT